MTRPPGACRYTKAVEKIIWELTPVSQMLEAYQENLQLRIDPVLTAVDDPVVHKYYCLRFGGSATSRCRWPPWETHLTPFHSILQYTTHYYTVLHTRYTLLNANRYGTIFADPNVTYCIILILSYSTLFMVHLLVIKFTTAHYTKLPVADLDDAQLQSKLWTVNIDSFVWVGSTRDL